MDGGGSFQARDDETQVRTVAQTDRLVHGRIGAAIRHRRQLMGLSLRELSAACGISLQQIQKYEVGASSISAAQLWRVAYAMAAPVEHFYQRIDAVATEPRTARSPAI